MTAPFARYGTVGTRGKLALNPMVFEPNGVGIFQGPNENADSMPPMALLTVPIALLTIPITLLSVFLIVPFMPSKTLTTVSLPK